MNNSQIFLRRLLTSDNVVTHINENMQNLLDVIPEISSMIGFEHKHPHHHLDVWQHTLSALSFSPNNFDVRLSLLLHDIGKPFSYQEDGEIRHFKGHPAVSSDIANKILSRLEFPKDYIQYICNIISHHDTPLTEIDISADLNLSRTLFEVQKCDALAHNPKHNAKRLEYIENTTKIFEKFENSQEFVKIKKP